MKRLMVLGALALAGGLSAADYVIRVADGTTVTNDVINTTDRVVIEAGTGTVVLRDGNTFGSEVVVSNGYLVADYAASGLQNTHLTLVGTANNRPAILRPKGPSFTAPVAASGAVRSPSSPSAASRRTTSRSRSTWAGRARRC